MNREDSNIKNLLDIHLAEYQALRNQIVETMKAQQALSNYSILIVGFAITYIAGRGLLELPDVPLLFLFTSCLLSAVNLAILDITNEIQDIGNYIQNSLTPKIQGLLPRKKKNFVVLGWEDFRTTKTLRMLPRAFTALGKFLIGYLPSIVAIFFFLNQRSNTIWATYEMLFFILAVTLAALVPLTGLLHLIFLLRRGNRP